MRTVSISDLKAHLSQYLREVQRGGEVQVLDRGVPIARLVAVGEHPEALDARRMRLIRAGIIRPGSGNAGKVLSTPPVRTGADLSQALSDDRADRS